MADVAAPSKSIIDLLRTIARIPFVDASVRARASTLLMRMESRDPFEELFNDLFGGAFRGMP